MNLELITQKFASYIEDRVDSETSLKEDTLYAKPESLHTFLEALKKDASTTMNMLMDLSAVDYLHWEEKEKRFEVLYNLFSLENNYRLFVKVRVDEKNPVLPSVIDVWPAADWYEREVYDMFGIKFEGHPNLKRILMYEGFSGHPLRKDYPYNKRQPIIGPHN